MKAQCAVVLINEHGTGLIGPFDSKDGARAFIDQYMGEQLESGNKVFVGDMCPAIMAAMTVEYARKRCEKVTNAAHPERN